MHFVFTFVRSHLQLVTSKSVSPIRQQASWGQRHSFHFQPYTQSMCSINRCWTELHFLQLVLSWVPRIRVLHPNSREKLQRMHCSRGLVKLTRDSWYLAYEPVGHLPASHMPRWGTRSKEQKERDRHPTLPRDSALRTGLHTYPSFTKRRFPRWPSWSSPSTFSRYLWSVEAGSHPQAAFLNRLNFAKFSHLFTIEGDHLTASWNTKYFLGKMFQPSWSVTSST